MIVTGRRGGGGGAGAASNVARIIGTGSGPPTGSLPMNFQINMESDFAAGLGAFDYSIASPALISPAGEVGQLGGLDVQGLDTREDIFIGTVTLIVSDLDGSEFIQLSGSVAANAGIVGDQLTVAPGDLSIDSQVGTDLSYQSGSGHVDSAAGGTFMLYLRYQGGWD